MTGRVEQDVVALDVAMNNLLGVQMLEASAGLPHQPGQAYDGSAPRD